MTTYAQSLTNPWAQVPIPATAPNLSRLAQSKPDYTFGYHYRAFVDFTSQSAVASVLEDNFSAGDRGFSLSSPSVHNKWPFVTIENYWEKDAGVARLQNMSNMSIMLHNRVMLRKEAGLQVPYGEAFIFGIEVSFKPGRDTYLNCGWVETKRSHTKRRILDPYHVSNLCRIT